MKVIYSWDTLCYWLPDGAATAAVTAHKSFFLAPAAAAAALAASARHFVRAATLGEAEGAETISLGAQEDGRTDSSQ